MDESVKDLLLAIAARVAKVRERSQPRDYMTPDDAYYDALWAVEHAIREAVDSARND